MKTKQQNIMSVGYRQSDILDFTGEEDFCLYEEDFFNPIEEDLDELWSEDQLGIEEKDYYEERSFTQEDWEFGGKPSQSKPGKGKNSIPSCVTAHCNEASKYQLLTQQQEVELANRIAKGDEQALVTLVNANLRLVIKIAGQIFRRKYEELVLFEMEDLISIGKLGLFKAARKFDPTKARFSTYAYRWIEQEIYRKIRTEDKEIHLSEQAGSAVSKVLKFQEKFHEDNGRYPTEDELAKGLKMSVTQIRNVFCAEETYKPAHLEAEIKMKGASSDDSELTLHEVTTTRSIETPEQEVEKRMSVQWVLDYLHSKGNKRNEEIFIRYSGILNDGEGETLAVISESVGVSKERVRQIYNGLREEIRELLIPESQR